VQRAIGSPVSRKKRLLAASIPLVVAGCIFLLTPSAFQRAFDDSLAHYPLAASIAQRDAHLRDIFLRQTEEAFNRGGWIAANKALKISLASEVEVYADDEHINAVSRAELMVLAKLEGRPAACKAYLLRGAERAEYGDATSEFMKLELAHKAAIENGFDRRASGIKWPKPSDAEISSVEERLGRGPAAELTRAELNAEAEYLDGKAEFICDASIKKTRNLLAMDDPDAADAERIRMANTANVDVARVMKRLAGD
jgi:hypothetical protein